MSAPMDEQAELRRQRDAFRDQRNAVFATNTELLARVERADLERLQVENENRTLKRRVAVLEMAIGTARAMHRKHSDSEHCQYDGMEWPCPNVIVLDGTVTVTNLAKAVDAMGALPMPTGSPEDPHDSPLHQSYATPRDLPEILTQRNGGQL